MIEIFFDGVIGEGENTASATRAKLRQGGPVTVRLNSPGGLAAEGNAIFNVLDQHPARVDVTVDSIAASAASLIAMAGDSITMLDGALLMIHDPAAVTVGNADLHRKSADVLDKMSEGYARIYAKRLGLTMEDARQMMKNETWLGADEAPERFPAITASGERVTASAPLFDYRMYRHAPANLIATAQVPERKEMDMPATAAPAAPVKTEAATPAPAADALTAIMDRCESAKLDLATTRKIIADSKGDLTAARDLIIDAIADTHGGDERIIVGQAAGGDEDGHAKAMQDAFVAKMQGKTAAGPFAGMSVSDLAAEDLRAKGVRLVAHDRTSIIRQALSTRQPFMSSAGMHTRSDFPIVLAGASQTVLGNLFQAADSGISQVAGVGTLPDFREKKLAKLSSFPDLEEIPEGAEFTYSTLTESGEPMSVATYGRRIDVSLQALVNDDLGAIARSLLDVAFGAVNMKAKLLLTALLDTNMSDGYPLFDATHHGNSGDYGSIAVSGLTTMRAKMRLQKALDNTTVLGLSPAVLLVGAGQETAAQQIVAALNPTQSDSVNPFSGLRLAVEPRLDAIDSGAHFVFADPAIMPAVSFLTLDATPAPRLEVQDPVDFSRLGTGYRVWWACGAAPVEYRAAVRNSGDAP